MAHEEGSNGTVNLLSLFPYFFLLFGSLSVLEIRIRIHKVAEYTDPVWIRIHNTGTGICYW